MQPAGRKYLTPVPMSGSRENERTQADMDEPVEKQWSKRHNWAACGEPYKTQLDALGSLWIEGSVSNEELACEALELLSEFGWADPGDPGCMDGSMDAVISQVKILTEALVAMRWRLPETQTPEARRHVLDSIRAKFGKEGRSR